MFCEDLLDGRPKKLVRVEAKTLKRAEPGKRAGGRRRRRDDRWRRSSQWRAVIRLRSSALGVRELTGHWLRDRWAVGSGYSGLRDRGKRNFRRRIEKCARTRLKLSFCRFQKVLPVCSSLSGLITVDSLLTRIAR